MSENRPIITAPVDRREETVVTQQPGYATTERVTRDVAAENRMRLFQVNRIIWSVLGLLEILLVFRFVMKLIGANPASGFGSFLYGITGPFLVPFTGLLPTPTLASSSIEATTIVAMAVYGLFFWGVVYVIRIVMDRPNARTVSRSTREITPGGERTTHTDSKG
jgi:uncharacterized protein YggT (Ycf19 family)